MPPIKRTGPLALTTTPTTNVYNPTQLEELRQVWVVNKTDNPATFSLWLGATGQNAAGTELFSKEPVPARTARLIPCLFKLTTADFIVGGADTATALTITLTTALVSA